MSQKEVWIKPRELWIEEDITETIVEYISVEEVVARYKDYLTEQQIKRIDDGNNTN